MSETPKPTPRTHHFLITDKKNISFYKAETRLVEKDGRVRREVESVKFVLWRKPDKKDRRLIRNFRPNIIRDPKKPRALATYINLKPGDRYKTPRPLRPGPKFTGIMGKQPIQSARFRVTYQDKAGRRRTIKLRYNYYSRRALKRFQLLLKRKRMPVPRKGELVNYRAEPGRQDYLIQRIVAFRRERGS